MRNVAFMIDGQFMLNRILALNAFHYDGPGIRAYCLNHIELDEEKSEIYKAIRETLNLYEYVASGVHQGVFDKDIVADLFRSNVIKTASVFSAYIDHINHEMNPRCNGSIWVNLKTLGAEFKNNYREGTKAGKRGPA